MPNDAATVEEYRVLRFDTSLSDDDVARMRSDGTLPGLDVRFAPPAFGRTYGLVRSNDEIDSTALQAGSGAVVFDGTVIAIAIEPSQPDALPLLERALREPGGMPGIRSVAVVDGSAVVELDTSVTPVNRLFAVVDVELARFGAPLRRTHLLAPMSANVMASVAAGGLACPEITPDRILESLLERPI